MAFRLVREQEIEFNKGENSSSEEETNDNSKNSDDNK